MLAFPHTSNWDLIALIVYANLHDVPLKFMIKDSVMKGPLGAVLKACGGVAVDRSRRSNLVEAMAETIGRLPEIALCVPPEGTRKRVEFWKSGFYHIARAAQVPVLLAFVDGPNRTFGTGPLVHLTGDMELDLNVIRNFYGDMKGLHPEGTSPIAFKPKEDGAAESALEAPRPVT